MTRVRLAAIIISATLIAIHDGAPLRAEGASTLAGRWTLSRQLSEFPRELGFGMDLVPVGGTTQAPSSGGSRRGRRGGSAGPTSGQVSAFASGRESPDDVKRLQQLTAEVRNPSTHFAITETATAVTITDDRGRARTFHPGAKEDVLQLDDVPVATVTKWDAGHLVILYKVEEGRELRYTFYSTADPEQLVVDVRFVEHGGGDSVRRVYEPAAPGESMTVAAAVPSPSPTSPAAPAPLPAALEKLPSAVTAAGPDRAPAPASADRDAPAPGPQQPDAELKGLTRLGVVVEGLGSESSACGLSQGAIETAVSKSLSDAGLTVLRNSDEDSYVYVNVNTVHLSTGFCVSRYDAFLYTHTMAKLSYQNTPVLVQVSLLHDGGIAGGAPAAHTEGVLKGVKAYVDQMASRIGGASRQGGAR
jgi:hypothetical protein